jgi:hypothetical protein
MRKQLDTIALHATLWDRVRPLALDTVPDEPAFPRCRDAPNDAALEAVRITKRVRPDLRGPAWEGGCRWSCGVSRDLE